MRTTIIPAQITTVEDKIAGNLTFTQMVLFLLPVIWMGVVYVLFSPAMHFSFYKIPFILLCTLVCFTLALKIRGKLILNWVHLIVTFNVRPAYFVFNKNEAYLRTLDGAAFEKKPILNFPALTGTSLKKKTTPHTDVPEWMRLEEVMRNHNLSFKSNKRGGFNVHVE